MESRDPSTNVILLEDTAAVLGVTIAATCMGLTSITGNYSLNYKVIYLYYINNSLICENFLLYH